MSRVLSSTEVRERLREAIGSRTAREVARETGFNPETIRRYLNQGSVPARFIASVAITYNVPIDRLLLDRPQDQSLTIDSSTLQTIADMPIGQLVAALAQASNIQEPTSIVVRSLRPGRSTREHRP